MRRLIRSLVLIFAKGIEGFIYYSGLIALIRFLQRKHAKILMYHEINEETNNVNAQGLEKQLKHIQAKYYPVSFSNISDFLRQKKALPSYGIALSFDDGYRDNYLNAYPLLRDYQIPAIIFLTTGYIGSRKSRKTNKLRYLQRMSADYDFSHLAEKIIQEFNVIDKKLFLQEGILALERLLAHDECEKAIDFMADLLKVKKDFEISENNLTWEQVREMAKEGIEFGCHTVNHPRLSILPAKRIEYEILQSKKNIEEKLGKACLHFAYPYGKEEDFNNSVVKMLREAGFLTASTNIKGDNSSATNPYLIKRIVIHSECNSLATFALRVCRINVQRSLIDFTKKIAASIFG